MASTWLRVCAGPPVSGSCALFFSISFMPMNATYRNDARGFDRFRRGL